MPEFDYLKATLSTLVGYLRTVWRDEKGMTTETAIITALLSIAAVGAATAIGIAIDNWLGRIR
jgi:Flp pilus assembly pilin Flp